MYLKQDLMLYGLLTAISLYVLFCVLLYSIRKEVSIYVIALILMTIVGLAIACPVFIIKDLLFHIMHPFSV